MNLVRGNDRPKCNITSCFVWQAKDTYQLMRERAELLLKGSTREVRLVAMAQPIQPVVVAFILAEDVIAVLQEASAGWERDKKPLKKQTTHGCFQK